MVQLPIWHRNQHPLRCHIPHPYLIHRVLCRPLVVPVADEVNTRTHEYHRSDRCEQVAGQLTERELMRTRKGQIDISENDLDSINVAIRFSVALKHLMIPLDDQTCIYAWVIHSRHHGQAEQT